MSNVNEFMVATAILGPATAFLGLLAHQRGREARKALDAAQGWFDKYHALQLKEDQRVAHLRKISAKGKEAQKAKAAEDSANRAVTREKTLQAVASTPMRSRAQVVASVKAKRTKAKKSAAGMAAKQGG